jgi:ABC-type cobalamin/Fe3+-siderophores transport system ATPase subunit
VKCACKDLLGGSRDDGRRSPREQRQQIISRREGAFRCIDQACPWFDPCAARRKGRREIDADQDHHWRLSAGFGNANAGWRPPPFQCPRDAIAAGVGVVHQERNLIPRFSVGENIMLDRLGGGFLRPIDYDNVHAQAKDWLNLVGLDLDSRTTVSRLSVAKMQMVEIAKALSLRSRVLLLDEPSASLTPHETVALFALLNKLRNDGVTIVFVSHKLEEVQDHGADP